MTAKWLAGAYQLTTTSVATKSTLATGGFPGISEASTTYSGEKSP
jgi:hypothetical protein